MPTTQNDFPPGNKLKITADAKVEIIAADGEAKRPTFSIVAYTGSPMNISGFYTPVIVDLPGLKASRKRIPILLDHDSTRIIGHATSSIDSGGVRLDGVITGEDSDAQKVITHARNGFEWQASIGATVVRQEFLKAGEKSVVNGREISGPILIARESRLYETSFVAFGADNQTSATVAASQSHDPLKGDHLMNFDAWLQAKGFDPAALNDVQKAGMKASFDAEQITAKAVVADPEVAKASEGIDTLLANARKEEARIAELTRITADAIRDRPMMLDELEKMTRLAITAKTSPVDFELTILRATRANAGPGILVRSTDRKATARTVEAAVCLSGGLASPEKHYDEQTLNAANDRFPHGLGLRDILSMAARENGYTGPTSSDVRGLLQAAFSTGQTIRADGFSTSSLPGMLGNVANKFLASGFAAVESAWREIAAIRSVRDFKTVTSYSLTGGMMYEKVGPGGELKHATLGELSYTNKADTYGRMFAITRQDIINDDLGALTQVPSKLGRGAALKLNDVFWTAFMNNSAFFTSGRGNYQSGATVGTNDTRLNVEGLTRGETLFMNQTDPDGYPVAIMPKILLVPNALFTPANVLMNSAEVRDTTANTNYGTSNPHTGKFRVVRSSYLSNTSYTGYSVVAWYLLADPADGATIEVAFLNGRDVPFVESADADFNTLGIQMRGYHDFGVGTQEYRNGIMSKGSA